MNNNAARSSRFPRREMLRRSIFCTAGFIAANGPLRGALVPTAAGAGAELVELPPLNRFPRMVQEYHVDRLREAEHLRTQRVAALRGRDQALAYVEEVRGKIQQCFGPWPEKTPLNARVTGVIQRDGYRVEKIIFESRPGFLVTGNLYVPVGRSLPLPGVVGTCGHSDNGKAAAPYQSFCQGLVRMGYVVFIIDPIGQGERLQYPDPATLRSRIGVGVREHLHAGNQQFLVGEFIGAWRAWDGIRALDYLLTREEVDPRHVGVTGNSGGGTMTTWLCGVETRWTMAAPSCFVTTFRRNLENELPADTEQCPPEAIALGLDHEDFIAAMAPKPVILLAKERDFFDIRGTVEAYNRLRELYRLLGAEENVDLFVGPSAHGYSQENREAMYGWFNRCTGMSAAQKEPELTLESDETLWCTPKGQVAALENGSRTVWSFTREKAVALLPERLKPRGAELRRSVAQALAVSTEVPVPEFRILRPVPRRRYPLPHATVYAVETEPGIQSLVYRLSRERHDARPLKTSGKAILYVSHRSSDTELRSEPLIRQLIDENPEATFYTCDVRGIGESEPRTCDWDSFTHPYGSDYFYSIHALMLGRPYVGRRTHDVLSVLKWIRSFGHGEVHLAGLAWGAMPAAFAAVLSDMVSEVTLKQHLTSFQGLAETEYYDWPPALFVPNVLSAFDLPDCYSELSAKGLRQIDPRDARV